MEDAVGEATVFGVIDCSDSVRPWPVNVRLVWVVVCVEDVLLRARETFLIAGSRTDAGDAERSTPLLVSLPSVSLSSDGRQFPCLRSANAFSSLDRGRQWVIEGTR